MTTQPPPTRNLQIVRYAVRGVLVLGVAASVAANVLHADPNPVSKVIAAWPPIALLIAIELVIHVPVDRPKVAWLRRAGTLLIAGIAAYVSYWHMAGVAERYGESGLSVFLLPLSVDGLIAVASICLVELSGRLRAESVPEAVKEKPRQARRTAGSNTPILPKAIEPAPNEEARNGHDRPQTVAAAVRVKPDKDAVAAAIRNAKALHGTDLEAVLEAANKVYPVSRETVRTNLRRERQRMNGHEVHA